jgi:hypothetical protein
MVHWGTNELAEEAERSRINPKFCAQLLPPLLSYRVHSDVKQYIKIV